MYQNHASVESVWICPSATYIENSSIGSICMDPNWVTNPNRKYSNGHVEWRSVSIRMWGNLHDRWFRRGEFSMGVDWSQETVRNINDFVEEEVVENTVAARDDDVTLVR